MLPELKIDTQDNENIQNLKTILDKGIDDLEAGRVISAEEALLKFRKEMMEKVSR